MMTDAAANYALPADYADAAEDVCFGCKNRILLFFNDEVQKTCGAFTRMLVCVNGEYRYKANPVVDNQTLSEGLGAHPSCEAVLALRKGKGSCAFREQATPFAFDERAHKPIATVQDAPHSIHNPRL